MLVVKAAPLRDALKRLARKKRKDAMRKLPIPVDLDMAPDGSGLRLTEAKFGAVCVTVPAVGSFDWSAQVDGARFRTIVETFHGRTLLEIDCHEGAVTIGHGNASLTLPWLASAREGGTRRRPLRPDPRHTGPVPAKPDPVGKRVELDASWLFSARMPVPQHRRPKRDED